MRIVVLFVIMVAVQWSVPISMIYQRESTRMQGKLFRFETTPIDPSDPFRGKYVTLNFVIATFKNNFADVTDGMEVFVTVASDSNGVAQIINLSKSPPTNSADFFKATVESYNNNTISLTFPFERFYLEESKAADVENIYNQNNRDNKRKPAYAEVYVFNGNVYLSDVKIEGKSVVDMVE
jgi:uncharacterized membrane-anchored protein